MQSRGCRLLPHRLERPLHPRVDRLTVLLRGVPTQVPRHVHGLIVEGGEVGWAEHAGLERGAVARDMDQEHGLAWQHRRIGGDRMRVTERGTGGVSKQILPWLYSGPGASHGPVPLSPPPTVAGSSSTLTLNGAPGVITIGRSYSANPAARTASAYVPGGTSP